MARSHHRKKHKEHLKQFKHSHDTASPKVKSKATNVFAFFGAIIGLVIAYFASDVNLTWILVGTAIGGLAGYFTGRNIDAAK